MVRLTSLGGAGLSGSQGAVSNDTVSLAPPLRLSVMAWIRMWYSVHGLRSVSLHCMDEVVKMDLYLPSLPLSERHTSYLILKDKFSNLMQNRSIVT